MVFISYEKIVNFEKLLVRVDDSEICEKLEVLFTTGIILDYNVIIEDIPNTAMSMLFYDQKDKWFAKYNLNFIFSKSGILNVIRLFYYDDDPDVSYCEIHSNYLDNNFIKPLDDLFEKLTQD